MADRRGEITIETVAEVMAVERQTLKVMYHPDEQVVHLVQHAPFGGDVQSITFPAGKRDQVIAAIRGVVPDHG